MLWRGLKIARCHSLMHIVQQHIPKQFTQQLTRPRRSQPNRLCKRNDFKTALWLCLGLGSSK